MCIGNEVLILVALKIRDLYKEKYCKLFHLLPPRQMPTQIFFFPLAALAPGADFLPGPYERVKNEITQSFQGFDIGPVLKASFWFSLFHSVIY
ncbi:hypothetical protein BKI52_32895 [marine bacterium AO1-C]|nr:hypothetical protein BKI52_32895 [marine bacterium AO1-C]